MPTNGNNPFRALARIAPPPLNVVADVGAQAVHDWANIVRGDFDPGNIDDWDPEYIERVLPYYRALAKTYFRSEVRGLDNVPDGASLIVGNHSGGTLIADTFVFAFEFYEHYGPNRRFHQLAHDVAAGIPGLGIRPFGTVSASHENAKKAFKKDAPVLVYPGGDWETFRPSWRGDEIDFAGRKGWVKLALEQGVPIVPLVAIGGQETALFLTRGRRIVKLTGLDRLTRIKVFPIQLAPPTGATVLDLPIRVPLPAKITIEVLPPIDLKERFGPDPDVDDVYEHVTDEMQKALSRLADERTLPVVG